MTLFTEEYQKRRKRENCCKSQQLGCHSEYSLSAPDPGPDPLLKEEVLTWLIRQYKKLELFPYQAKEGDQRPTAAELSQAKEMSSKFQYFDHGKVVVLNKEHQQNIVAIIQFIPLDELTPEQLNNLGTVSTGVEEVYGYLQACRNICLRKKIQSAKDDYDSLMRSSYKPSAILGKNFQDVAKIAFEANCKLMAENYIPAFCSLPFQDPLQELNCSPNVTFTTSGFYNPPHKDTGDAQEFAFLLFLPINNHNGSLIQSTDEYHWSGHQKK
ncbi:hypothetical protein PCASD_22341 [Puccinia coronata f. sp. avenae]|uniref:Tet-like 2OG-Fe(II) oxygenase domain-containing protein n=1 Tax=Puccinia coronata f. sp. avenae TaxID=200324 RepID=A0A2N5U8E5_9BASI|nr:hypothetical protein PCASD_22341 [Puccinia coronata f. sp. avenae]